jgi:enoyl-CoA hydratase/carnithine racemase
MESEHIITERHGRVGIIRFNRPEELNTLHPGMFREVCDQLELWNVDGSVGAVVLTGEGRAFCAGGHFGAWKSQLDGGSAETDARPPRRPTSSQEFWSRWAGLVRDSKPIIVAINGPAIGAGTTLTLPADVRIAGEAARFSMRFARIGITPEFGSTFLLPRLVGLGHAMELALSGRIIDAHEACRIGLVNRVAPQALLMDVAVEVAAEIAFNPTEGLRAIKSMMWDQLEDPDLEEAQEKEWVALDAAMAKPAFREAVDAFLEKREPRFHPP